MRTATVPAEPQPSPRHRPPSPEDVLRAVGNGRSRALWHRVALGVSLVVVTGVGLWRFNTSATTPPTYETVAIDRGSIQETVQATGTLEARRVVSVGGEISGRIATVEVEVNDRVTKGQILATLDPVSLDHALTQAKAALTSTRIDVTRAKTALQAAATTKTRTESLYAGRLVPAEELESARSAYDLAKMDYSRAKSERDLAALQVKQAETDRTKATITSPIDGVVLSRSVEPGNAIAASLEAPELFILAEDLAQMRLNVGVDEADVGRVETGQTATFTVDAWPDRSFTALVERVNLAPTTDESSTVVTYTAVLSVDNHNQTLRPGMTATATILIAQHNDVLRVPVVALRFDPKRALASETSTASSLFQPPRPGGRDNEGSKTKVDAGRGQGTVYRLAEGNPQSLNVTVGATDGQYSEITSSTLEPGDDVVVGLEVTP